MAQHLKTRIICRLQRIASRCAPHARIAASHARGVRYLVPAIGIDAFWGAMNTVKEGRRYRKHIVARRVPRSGGQLLQLYTYHFPKTWSAACIANRELIKTAQRITHTLEHDYSLVALEWRIRFFRHYFRVFLCGESPEQGMKRYSRFYQYTYVAVYRELRAASQPAVQTTEQPAEEVTFTPVYPHPHRRFIPLRSWQKEPSGRHNPPNSCICAKNVVPLRHICTPCWESSSILSQTSGLFAVSHRNSEC